MKGITWEIRGQRVLDGAVVDLHVGVGFGSTPDGAIRWLRRNSPQRLEGFEPEKLRAIPDPETRPAPASCSIASLLFAVCVLTASFDPSPGMFRGGLSAALPSSALDAGDGSFASSAKLDRDFWFGIAGSILAVIVLGGAGMSLDHAQRMEDARRLNDLHRRLAGSPTPGALRDFQRPADPTGAGERRGFSTGQ